MKRNSTVAAHRVAVMSRGELRFCLRTVHRYWSTPRLTSEELEYLEQENLIERAPTGLGAIRLTEQGAFIRDGGQELPRRVTPHSEPRRNA